MLVNKDVIYKLYEEGKIRKQEDSGAIRNWSKIYPQLYIYLEERINMANNSNLDI